MACVGEDRLVLWAGKSVYAYDLTAERLLPDAAPIRGSRPLTVCNEPDRCVYYGEYRGGRERGETRVFRSEDGGRTWEAVYAFPQVRHVHGVFHDCFEDALWVTTGDDGGDAAIWVTRDRFETLERVAGGRQQTRAVTLLFAEDYVYFGSDTPLEVNHLCRLSRRDGGVEELGAVEGSVFHGCRTGGGLFFSTACEPSRVNKSRQATVWGSVDGETWRRVIQFRKDVWPFKLFQYGQVFFANGQETGPHLWLTPFAARPDQVSLKIDPGIA